MKRNPSLLMMSLVIAGFVLVACSGGTPASLVGTWRLVSYGPPSGLTPAVPEVDTSIEFTSGGALTGNVGCNGFGGDYKVDGNSITFEQVTATLMFCEGPVGEQEAATLAVIQGSAAYALDGDTLTITSADGNSVIVLERKS